MANTKTHTNTNTKIRNKGHQVLLQSLCVTGPEKFNEILGSTPKVCCSLETDWLAGRGTLKILTGAMRVKINLIVVQEALIADISLIGTKKVRATRQTSKKRWLRPPQCKCRVRRR